MTSQLTTLGSFVGTGQALTLFDCLKGEERGYFVKVLNELLTLIECMPKTYEQDGLGDKAVAYLHYFKGSCDWYITEKDMGTEQYQAFGLANLGYGGELGYINLEEITAAGVELDLHWTPKPLAEVKK